MIRTRAWYSGKAVANFGLKHYDQAIERARRAIASSELRHRRHGPLWRRSPWRS